ncbi:helix-turn-helix domain-containing protein [Enterococcus avium]|uniref:Helix-turn-helix domain-containing protein n=1 Tax=Enterococcus avium TaxID=33945 RepID=A0A8B5W8X4_ENTAV|nr:RodZ domain-containing protein [Enterococcus avium]TRZ35459.1 helix-turn-helix domain-containing protein [Enterococcus avium]
MASINIGETLRKARIDKKISLDELQQRTKIQKRYLLAIEENDFHELPSDYYLRTFIRQYADEVKLDGNYLIDVLDGKDRPMPTYPELETVDGLRKNKHVESPTRARFKATLPMILLGLVALAIISVVGYMTWLDHQETAIIPENSSVQVERSDVSLSVAEKVSSSQPKPVESSKEPEKPKMAFTMENNTTNAATMKVEHAEKPLKISFTGTERVWVGVQVNGALTYQKTLEKGESETTELPAGTAQAVITVGMAKYAEVKINDQALDFQPGNSLLQKNITLNIAYAS